MKYNSTYNILKISNIRKAVMSICMSACLLSCFNASAVTRDDMEQARTIAAKTYLRWANNGSGYLDGQNPKTMDELERLIKSHSKDVDNLKAFKKTAFPADFESWDKAKLVEFWSVTAFAAPGLNKEGASQGARSAAKSALSKLNPSAPSAPKPEATNVPNDGSGVANAADTAQAIPDEIAENNARMDSIQQVLEETPLPSKKNNDSYTWLYIVILSILIIAVIALVAYASKAMKNSEEDEKATRRAEAEQEKVTKEDRRAAKEERRAIHEERRQTEAIADITKPANSNAEKFAAMIAEKDSEIRSLRNRVLDLENESRQLSSENAQLTHSLQTLQARLEAAEAKAYAPQPAPAAQPAPAPQPAPIGEQHRVEALGARVQPQPAPAPQPAPVAPQPAAATKKRIFLGRVNQNGLFVRADRTLNPGLSLYVLETDDNFSGTFRVVDDPSAFAAAKANPTEMLGGGCMAKDLTTTAGYSGIATDSAGTAIFENNCWRVIRKARIHYV